MGTFYSASSDARATTPDGVYLIFQHPDLEYTYLNTSGDCGTNFLAQLHFVFIGDNYKGKVIKIGFSAKGLNRNVKLNLFRYEFPLKGKCQSSDLLGYPTDKPVNISFRTSTTNSRNFYDLTFSNNDASLFSNNSINIVASVFVSGHLEKVVTTIYPPLINSAALLKSFKSDQNSACTLGKTFGWIYVAANSVLDTGSSLIGLLPGGGAKVASVLGSIGVIIADQSIDSQIPGSSDSGNALATIIDYKVGDTIPVLNLGQLKEVAQSSKGLKLGQKASTFVKGIKGAVTYRLLADGVKVGPDDLASIVQSAFSAHDRVGKIHQLFDATCSKTALISDLGVTNSASVPSKSPKSLPNSGTKSQSMLSLIDLKHIIANVKMPDGSPLYTSYDSSKNQLTLTQLPSNCSSQDSQCSSTQGYAVGVWSDPISTAFNSFTCKFDFIVPDGTSLPGDGLAFVVQSAGLVAPGGGGANLGYQFGVDNNGQNVSGISGSVAVGFQTFSNNSIVIGSSGVWMNTVPVSFSLVSKNPYHVVINYNRGTQVLDVLLKDSFGNSISVKSPKVTIPLSNLYFGFTGAMGYAAQTTIINNFNLTFQ